MRKWIEEKWLLPYLQIGGKIKEFWSMTPRELKLELKAYEMREKNQLQKLWLLGKYFQIALASTPVAMGNPKGSLPKFPEMPYKEEQEEKINEKLLQKEREKAFSGFVSLLMNCKKGK